MRTTRTLGRLAAAAACLSAVTAGGIGAATAASGPDAGAAAEVSAAARPTLKVPFPCQQDWRGGTRTNHDPLYAVDFNQGSGEDDNGRAVKSSGAGTVSAAGNVGAGYGNRIIINHGNGWSTLYAHLKSINVSPGQSVGATTTIGTVGSTGGDWSSHLHYEQRLNGADVRAVFGSSNEVYYYGERIYTRTVC